MERTFKVTDEYIEKITSLSKINKEKLDSDLSNNTQICVELTNNIRKVLKDYTKAMKEYDVTYNDRYAHYSYKAEIVPQNDKEKEFMIKSDSAMQEAQQLVDDIDRDREWLENQRKIFLQRSWDMKCMADWLKFLAGK